MSESTPTPPVDEPADGQLERFEVVLTTLGAESADERGARTVRVSALDLDRLPDRDNVRLLVDAEQLDRLRAAGLSVSIQRSVPVRPLDPSLVATDEDVSGWLTARLGPDPDHAVPPGPLPADGPDAASTADPTADPTAEER